jgi:hypothetical protein
MTFTYDLVTPGDLTRVRYHIGDTEEATAIFSDEEINFVLDEETTYQAAVISCINAIIGKLSHEPDMQADWLKIDWRRSAESWMKLLAEKKSQFGLGARAASGGQHAWRPDTLMDEAPAYDD